MGTGTCETGSASHTSGGYPGGIGGGGGGLANALVTARQAMVDQKIRFTYFPL